MPSKRIKAVDFIREADACLDWFSVHKMDVMTVFLRGVLPQGFWGDGYSGNIACHPCPSASRVYLTFDDGPSPATTPWLLEMLEKEGIQASFFLIGRQAESNAELVRDIHRAGHSIGNHSYRHLFMPGLASKEIENEIERTNRIIKEITGEPPRIFRPPYGFMDRRAARVLFENSMHPVYWSQAPEDWSIPGAHRVVRRLLMRLKPGNLIVLHEGRYLKEQTLAAAKEIIYRCKSSAYDLEKVQLSA
jgi:peptidoglycan-N-acetylglucosamine deacetylase